MLETDTIVFMLLFCAISITFYFLREKLLRNSAKVKEYLDKVDSEQEAIPVDEASWYYRGLKKHQIKTTQELYNHLTRNLQAICVADRGVNVLSNLFLVSGMVVYAVFIISLIFNTEETKVNIALLLGASLCVIAYLLMKTILENSKAINRVVENYLEKVPESIMIPREK
jgi:hypothetical protein